MLKASIVVVNKFKVESGVAYTDYTAQEQMDGGNDQCCQHDIDGASREEGPNVGVKATTGGEDCLTGNLKAQVCIAAFNIQVDFRTFVASAAQQDCDKTHDDRDAPFAT